MYAASGLFLADRSRHAAKLVDHGLERKRPRPTPAELTHPLRPVVLDQDARRNRKLLAKLFRRKARIRSVPLILRCVVTRNLSIFPLDTRSGPSQCFVEPVSFVGLGLDFVVKVVPQVGDGVKAAVVQVDPDHPTLGKPPGHHPRCQFIVLPVEPDHGPGQMAAVSECRCRVYLRDRKFSAQHSETIMVERVVDLGSNAIEERCGFLCLESGCAHERTRYVDGR